MIENGVDFCYPKIEKVIFAYQIGVFFR